MAESGWPKAPVFLLKKMATERCQLLKLGANGENFKKVSVTPYLEVSQD